MAKKVRVYELARELGISNKDALDLCVSLGIGAKSHSSSIEEAQADRVRRKADAEGLRREPITSSETGKADADSPAVPSSIKRGAGSSKSEQAQIGDLQEVASSSAQSGTRVIKSSSPGVRTARITSAKPSEAQSRSISMTRPPSGVPSQAEPQQSPAVDQTADKLTAPVHAETVRLAEKTTDPLAVGAPLEGAIKGEVQLDGGESGKAKLDGELAGGSAASSDIETNLKSDSALIQSSGPTSPLNKPPANAGRTHKTTEPRDSNHQQGRQLSPTGKPIPPPPGRPLSPSGKAIPPPPGARGPRSSGTPSTPQGGPQTRPSDRTTPARRFISPSQLARSGGTAFSPQQGTSGRPGARGASAPSAPTGPGGPRGGGPAGRGRPPQQRSRSRRRRRNLEELEPTQITTSYVPSNAPVPDGEVIVERGSTAQVLGPKLNRISGDVIRFLLLQGEMVTATQSLSDEMIELFADEIGATVKLVDPGEEQEALLAAKYFESDEEEEQGQAEYRPPVVTVMGHVDHGKTTLLDTIRNANVASGEAGGITQHIGAYMVGHAGKSITFIDTPGHEAFTAMRARGAQVTDLVVLVVAANDGVMPQTVEAISHARASEVPIIVAITKVDRPDSDPNRVMQQLSEHGLVPESWGGDTVTIEVSPPAGVGVDDLLEHIVLLAELQELTAVKEGSARGAVLEANLDVGRGPVATVLVQRGHLKLGDVVVAGPAWGKVKALIDDSGLPTKGAGPSTPVVLLGLSTVPSAGDEFRVVSDQSTARTIAEAREQRIRALGHAPIPSAARAAKLEDLFEQVSRGELATLNLILKADVQGSLEALTDSLRKLEREEVRISFVHRAVGAITENDVSLAAASGATIIGFNVRPDRRAREAAESQGVEIRTYEVVYKILEDIEAALVGMLKPEFEEVVTGEAEVREVFRVPKIGPVAGCYVRSGTITRGSKVRFLREGVIIWKGTISSLRRFKDDVRDVSSGFECGIGLSDFQDLKDGDIIETFEDREITRT